MRFLIFQVNANFAINQLKNIFAQNTWHCFFRASKNLRSPSQNFLKTSTFHPIFTSFYSGWVLEVCNITNEKQRLYFFPLFRKQIGALHRSSFSKHPLFTTFSLFLKMSEVCTIRKRLYNLPLLGRLSRNTSLFFF